MAPILCIGSKGLMEIISAVNRHLGRSKVNLVLLKRCLKCLQSFGYQHDSRQNVTLKRQISQLQRVLISKGKKSPRHRAFWNQLADLLPKAARSNLRGKVYQIKERAVVPRTLVSKASAEREQARSLLDLSALRRPVPFWFAAPGLLKKSSKKLSEGSWGEIYLISGEDDKKTEAVVKCIPVGGVDPNSGEKQLSYSEIVPEITSALTLSSLKEGECFRTPNFPKIRKICCVQDAFPKNAIQKWDEYKKKYGSWHCRPNLYSCGQTFITIETEMCGKPLDTWKLEDTLKACSIFMQTAISVAVAEEAFNFEHRDLHTGNLLVRECESGLIEYRLHGMPCCIRNFGVFVSIIDYTYSRISTAEGVQYLNLDGLISPSRSSAEKFLDNRFVYAKMEEANNKMWKHFSPISNVYWMKHLTVSLKKLMEDIPDFPEVLKHDKNQLRGLLLLNLFDDTILLHESVTSFVRQYILHEI